MQFPRNGRASASWHGASASVGGFPVGVAGPNGLFLLDTMTGRDPAATLCAVIATTRQDQSSEMSGFRSDFRALIHAVHRPFPTQRSFNR